MPITLTTLLQHALAHGSRSTVLKSLAWLIAICFGSSLGAFQVSAPLWLGASFAVAGLLAVIVYIAAFIYFAFKNPDALRSETYTIQKLAIEKGLVGDDIVGMSTRNAMRIDEELANAKSVNASDAKLLEDGE